MALSRATGFAIATAIVAVVGAAAAAEFTVRAVAASDAVLAAELRSFDVLRLKVEPHATGGYRPRPGSRWHYGNGAIATINAQGFRGTEVPAERGADVLRIVLLGGSTSFGWGVNDDATIAVALETVLDARLGSAPDGGSGGPGRWRDAQVVNAAFDGYDSFQILERIRSDIVALRPDLVIVNTGINDVRHAPLQDIVDGDRRILLWRAPMVQSRALLARGGPTLRERAEHHSVAIRFALLVRRRLTAKPPVHREVVAHGDAADHFERNLRAIGRIAAAQRFALVLSTAPSALRTRHAPDDTSTISYWIGDAATTAAYRDTLAARLARVTADLSQGGQRIAYLRPALGPEHFLDDAHLTAAGNRAMAEALAEAITSVLADDSAASKRGFD